MKSTWDLLEQRYPTKEYTLLREVRNAAGFSASRSADGMVIGHWPSRGCEIEGLELKANRGDWINELRNPAKAEEIFKFCDKWWIVAERENIVKIEEVPTPWGFMECSNEKLKVIKQAPKLEPVSLTRGIVVSMIKRATAKMDGMIDRDSIGEEIKKARDEGTERAKIQYERVIDNYTLLKEALKTFEEKSGVDINQWNAGNIGNAVKIVLFTENRNIKRELENLQIKADSISEAIKGILNDDVSKA
jgi:hypothetical protein